MRMRLGVYILVQRAQDSDKHTFEIARVSHNYGARIEVFALLWC
jgi:hypothetical protein